MKAPPMKYPTREPSNTKNLAILRLAQRNKVFRAHVGDRLTSSRAGKRLVTYSRASSSGLPSVATAASTPSAVNSPLTLATARINGQEEGQINRLKMVKRQMFANNPQAAISGNKNPRFR